MGGYFEKLKLRACNKTLRDSQATPEARCAVVNFGFANHPGVAWWFEWKCRVRPLLRIVVARPGELRTFEIKPTSQAWQAARKEPQSPPLIRSWNENLDSTANGFPSSSA